MNPKCAPGDLRQRNGLLARGGAVLSVLFEISAAAAVRCVDVNSASPAPPHTNWAAAANVIQDVVDAAVAGEQIAVTDGAGQQLSDTLPDAVQKSVTGTLGVATQRAFVNLAELARQEALAHSTPPAAPAASRPVVPSSDGPPGKPLDSVTDSAFLTASFPALTDIGEAAVPDTHRSVGPGHPDDRPQLPSSYPGSVGQRNEHGFAYEFLGTAGTVSAARLQQNGARARR